jgi:molybdate transport system ATP-binding protein
MSSGQIGSAVRVQVLAHEVLLSRKRPEGLSAQNILPATVEHIARGEGPGILVRLRAGDDIFLARVTRRAAASMKLAPGMPCFAILKSMAVARDHVVAIPRDAG